MSPTWSARIGRMGSPKRTSGNAAFAEVRHDRGGSKPEAHLGERERSIFRNQHEVAHNRQPETESKRVALHFGNTDDRRSAQRVFEFDQPRRFFAEGLGIVPGSFAPGAEDFAACAYAQDASYGIRGFRPQLLQHGVKHCARNFVTVIAVVQRKHEDVRDSLDDYAHLR